MTTLEFSLVVWTGALAAGFLGSLTGLGGGIVVVPLLVWLGVDIRYAIGAALVSVIATSSGAAAAYVKEGFANVRIGIFLELATTLGAITGAYLATTHIPTPATGREGEAAGGLFTSCESGNEYNGWPCHCKGSTGRRGR